MKRISHFCLIPLLVLVSCQQRYGYLSKVRAPKAKSTESTHSKRHITKPAADPEEWLGESADTGRAFVLPGKIHKQNQKQSVETERWEKEKVSTPKLSKDSGVESEGGEKEKEKGKEDEDDEERPPLNYYAAWSMYGILSMILIVPIFLGPVLFMLGIKALYSIRKYGGGGKGWAIAAIVFGTYFLIMYCFIVFIEVVDFIAITIVLIWLSIAYLCVFYLIKNSRFSPDFKPKLPWEPLSSVNLKLLHTLYVLAILSVLSHFLFISLAFAPITLMYSLWLLKRIPRDGSNRRIMLWLGCVIGILGILSFLIFSIWSITIMVNGLSMYEGLIILITLISLILGLITTLIGWQKLSSLTKAERTLKSRE